MFKVEYKMKKVKRDGMNKLIPMRRKSVLGFGQWIEDPDWKEEEQRLAEEKFLGLEQDSTVTQIHAFIEKRNPEIVRNRFYND